MLYDNQSSYEVDFAAEIDTPAEIIADELNISLEAAERVLEMKQDEATAQSALALARVIGFLLNAKNLHAAAYGLAIATGLDQLNGIKSQTEVAKKLGCTRALVSHYTIAARDALSCNGHSIDVLKYRKRNETRQTYAQQATDPFTAAKIEARKKYNQTNK